MTVKHSDINFLFGCALLLVFLIQNKRCLIWVPKYQHAKTIKQIARKFAFWKRDTGYYYIGTPFEFFKTQKTDTFIKKYCTITFYVKKIHSHLN